MGSSISSNSIKPLSEIKRISGRRRSSIVSSNSSGNSSTEYSTRNDARSTARKSRRNSTSTPITLMDFILPLSQFCKSDIVQISECKQKLVINEEYAEALKPSMPSWIMQQSSSDIVSIKRLDIQKCIIEIRKANKMNAFLEVQCESLLPELLMKATFQNLVLINPSFSVPAALWRFEVLEKLRAACDVLNAAVNNPKELCSRKLISELEALAIVLFDAVEANKTNSLVRHKRHQMIFQITKAFLRSMKKILKTTTTEQSAKGFSLIAKFILYLVLPKLLILDYKDEAEKSAAKANFQATVNGQSPKLRRGSTGLAYISESKSNRPTTLTRSKTLASEVGKI